MNTLEEMTERFALLPVNIQEAITAFDYDHRLQKIHKKYKLHIDQSVQLETLLANIIFGDMKSTELTTHVERDLRLTRDKAVEISLEINNDILLPLREKIKETQAKSDIKNDIM